MDLICRFLVHRCMYPLPVPAAMPFPRRPNGYMCLAGNPKPTIGLRDRIVADISRRAFPPEKYPSDLVVLLHSSSSVLLGLQVVAYCCTPCNSGPGAYEQAGRPFITRVFFSFSFSLN